MCRTLSHKVLNTILHFNRFTVRWRRRAERAEDGVVIFVPITLDRHVGRRDLRTRDFNTHMYTPRVRAATGSRQSARRFRTLFARDARDSSVARATRVPRILSERFWRSQGLYSSPLVSRRFVHAQRVSRSTLHRSRARGALAVRAAAAAERRHTSAHKANRIFDLPQRHRLPFFCNGRAAAREKCALQPHPARPGAVKRGSIEGDTKFFFIPGSKKELSDQLEAMGLPIAKRGRPRGGEEFTLCPRQ